MKMIEVVHQLQRQGHSVSYYVRKDGGLLIKSIDGMQFPSGASGNAYARQLTGSSLSEAREKQLKYATRQHVRKKMSIDDEIEKEYKRVKRKWDKAFKAKEGKPHHAGYFGKGRIEYTIKHYGKEEALRRIREAERYTSGLAYSKNVAILSTFVRNAGISYRSEELIQLANDIDENAYAIREEWIDKAYEALYKLDEGQPPQEVAASVRKILRLSNAG